MSVYLRGSTFWMAFTVKGERYRLSTGSDSLKEAQRIERDMIHRAEQGLAVETPKANRASVCITLRDAFDRMLEGNWKHQRSASTHATNAKVVCKYLGDATPLDTIEYEDILELRDSMESDGYAPATINRKLACLSVTMKTAVVQWRIIKAKPYFQFIEENNRRMRLITADETLKILQFYREAGDEQMADFVVVASETGARRSEILKLRSRDVDTQRGVVRFWMTKNGESRAVPLTPKAAAALDRRGDDLFSTLSKDRVEHRWQWVRTKMGLDGDREFVIHAFRHTVATNLIEATGNIYAVMEWMGHRRIETTQRYAKMTLKNLEATRDKFVSATALNRPTLSVTQCDTNCDTIPNYPQEGAA